MFEGKMLRELAGIPMRRIDLANSALALAEPDPLTLANLTTKSLTLCIAAISRFDCDAIGSGPVKDGHFRVSFRHPGKSEDPEPRVCARRPWVPASGAMERVNGRGTGVRPGLSRARICACPMPRSGSARRIVRNAGRHPRP